MCKSDRQQGQIAGDFARGLDHAALAPAIRAGLENHRAVDRFTDADPRIKALKKLFSPARRRFAGIALDMYFDHLLIRHWARFETGDIDARISSMYRHISEAQALMPNDHMRQVTMRMVEYDWFGSYRDIDAVAESLDRVAGRIRFPNRFDNAIEDLLRNQDMIRDIFFEFYPRLQQHVAELALETPLPAD